MLRARAGLPRLNRVQGRTGQTRSRLQALPRVRVRVRPVRLSGPDNSGWLAQGQTGQAGLSGPPVNYQGQTGFSPGPGQAPGQASGPGFVRPFRPLPVVRARRAFRVRAGLACLASSSGTSGQAGPRVRQGRQPRLQGRQACQARQPCLVVLASSGLGSGQAWLRRQVRTTDWVVWALAVQGFGTAGLLALPRIADRLDQTGLTLSGLPLQGTFTGLPGRASRPGPDLPWPGLRVPCPVRSPSGQTVRHPDRQAQARLAGFGLAALCQAPSNRLPGPGLQAGCQALEPDPSGSGGFRVRTLTSGLRQTGPSPLSGSGPDQAFSGLG